VKVTHVTFRRSMFHRARSARIRYPRYYLFQNVRLPVTFHRGRRTTKEDNVIGLIVFAAIVLALVVTLGLPYPQSWKSRWGNYDR
jgi:hypothetical protein